MNERKINVLEVGEYKKNLEDVTHYIDDCINRIYGGIKALTSQNIIEGEISNTLEDAYEELSKIRTEVNEELDSFTGWIGKNIEDTTLLDERHARELENELNSMDFFKDGYTISGGNAFLTGDNNMKFNSPNGTKEDNNSSDNNQAKDNNSKDSDKQEEIKKQHQNDKSENKEIKYQTRDVFDDIKGEYRRYDGEEYDYTLYSLTYVKNNKYNLNEVKNEYRIYEEYNDTSQKILTLKNGKTSDDIKEYFNMLYKENGIGAPLADAINKYDSKDLSYKYVIKTNIDGISKDWEYKTSENLTTKELYSKYINYLEENTTNSSIIDFPQQGQVGVFVQTKDE